MHLDAGMRAHYLDFLRERFPDLLDSYARLYRGKYAPSGYTARVSERARRQQAVHGLGEREREPEQPASQLVLL